MTSNLAQEDLDDLRAEGCLPTDDDIVRLHALGVRVSMGAEQSAVDAPRFAWVGGVCFHEPTLAAYEWYERVRSIAEDEMTDDWLFAFACANARVPHAFDAINSRDDIARELGKFMGRIYATRKEVVRALMVVTGRANEVEEEPTEIEKKTKEGSQSQSKELTQSEVEYFSKSESLLTTAVASLGLSISEVMAQTPSRIMRLIYAHHSLSGEKIGADNARAYAVYMATFHAIAKRLRAERDARKAKETNEVQNG